MNQFVTEVTEEMLRTAFADNNWDHIIVHFTDGSTIGITAYSSYYGDEPRKESHIEWYEVSWGIDWEGANKLSDVVRICNTHADITRRNLEEKNKLRAYFDKHIKDGNYTAEEWDWYSDWHKDCYGYRPHGIVCGEYINPHAVIC